MRGARSTDSRVSRPAPRHDTPIRFSCVFIRYTGWLGTVAQTEDTAHLLPAAIALQGLLAFFLVFPDEDQFGVGGFGIGWELCTQTDPFVGDSRTTKGLV